MQTWVTVREYAARPDVRCSERTVRRLIKKEILEAKNIGAGDRRPTYLIRPKEDEQARG